MDPKLVQIVTSLKGKGDPVSSLFCQGALVLRPENKQTRSVRCLCSRAAHWQMAVTVSIVKFTKDTE